MIKLTPLKVSIFYRALFFAIIVIALQSFTNSTKNLSHSFIIGNDNDLVLKLEIIESKKILRVSFNGNEGTDGSLIIFNDQNKPLVQSNFELIKTPFYASVDVSTLSSGKYKVELTTPKGKHTTSLTIN